MVSGIQYGNTGESYWVRTGRRVELFFHMYVAGVGQTIPTVARIGPLPFLPSDDALWYPATIEFAEGFGKDLKDKIWSVHLRNDEDSFRVYVTDNVTSQQVYVNSTGVYTGCEIIGTAIYYTNDTEMQPVAVETVGAVAETAVVVDTSKNPTKKAGKAKKVDKDIELV